MKRVLTILAILILPLSVWAMTPITDSALSDVTGQAGVNISLDMKMNVEIGTVAWGDSDGIAEGTGFNPWADFTNEGGYVGINDLNISNLWIRARIEAGDNFNHYNILLLKPLTIDVATGEKEGVADVTFVRIGIGALQISMDELSITLALGNRTDSTDLSTNVLDALDQEMGVVSLGALSVYINPFSYVDIYAHPDGSMGVNLDVNMTIDRISLGYVSWGDEDGVNADVLTTPYLTDDYGTLDPAHTKVWMIAGDAATATGLGATTATNAGYVGLRDFNLGDASYAAVIINGTVAIDVNTTNLGVYVMLNALASTLANRPSDGIGAFPLGNGNLGDPNYELTPAAVEAVLGGYFGDVSGTQLSALMTIYGLTGAATSGYGDGLGTLTGTQVIEYFLNEGGTYDPATYAAHLAAFIADWETNAGGFFFFKPISAVHISFPNDFFVSVAKMTANVAVGNTPALVTPQVGILGDIYIQGVDLTVLQNSWVDIWAH